MSELNANANYANGAFWNKGTQRLCLYWQRCSLDMWTDSVPLPGLVHTLDQDHGPMGSVLLRFPQLDTARVRVSISISSRWLLPFVNKMSDVHVFSLHWHVNNHRAIILALMMLVDVFVTVSISITRTCMKVEAGPGPDDEVICPLFSGTGVSLSSLLL